MKSMKFDINTILENLTDAGCSAKEIETAKSLCEAGQADALIIHLRKCRCHLMDELHQSQRKVDRLDYLVHTVQEGRKSAGL